MVLGGKRLGREGGKAERRAGERRKGEREEKRKKKGREGRKRFKYECCETGQFLTECPCCGLWL